MTDVEDRIRQALNAEAERAQPEMLAPLRAPRDSRWPGWLGFQAGAGRRGTAARSVLVPLAAAAAVVAVIAGVFALRAAPPPRPATGSAAAGLPRFYVVLGGTPGRMQAEVRDSATGTLLSSLRVPAVPGPSPWIAAGSDRSYALAVPEHSGNVTTRFYQLRLSADGRTETLTRLPVKPLAGWFITGIALAPSGRYLAIGLENGSMPHVRGAVEVVSAATGAARTWYSRAQYGYPFDLAWADHGRRLGFGWYYHFTGHYPNIYSLSDVRLLSLSAPGRTLLDSRVIVPQRRSSGTIQSALVAPDGRSVVASVTKVVPHGGYYHGTVVARIARFSAATGRQTAVYRTLRIPYHSNRGEYLALASCQVTALDVTGRNVLAECRHLGRLAGSSFTPLPGTVLYSLVPAAAW